jgi:hypothetical protein
MLKKKKYNSLAEVFEEMVEEDISKRGYDMYKTDDGDYHCRECTSIVQRYAKWGLMTRLWLRLRWGKNWRLILVPHLQNCPNCKKNIDWTKIIVSADEHAIRKTRERS